MAKLSLGSLQKTSKGNKVIIMSPFNAKQLLKLANNPEIIALANNPDKKAKKYLNLESKKEQAAFAEQQLADGKSSQESYTKSMDRINNIPEFVMAELFISVNLDNS